MIDVHEALHSLIGPAVNIGLISIIGYFIKAELNGIKDRLTRIENTFFK